MNTRPEAQPGIEQIKLYTPGEAPKQGAELRKLSSNENLYGPSPKAIEAVRASAENLWKYPSVSHDDLRHALAQVHNLPEERLICGAGSDEILALIAQAYAGQGDEVIMTEHGFEVYGIVTHAVGAELVVAPERERVVDVDAILKKITGNTRIIFIANPANPTGTMIDEDALARLVQGGPKNCLIVLDGAYAEFADGYDGGANLVAQNENVIMTRTFSKLYGLGGLRVGWAYGPSAVIDNLNRIRGPFNLSTPALSGAKEAILDQDYAQNCQKQICEDREYLRGALSQYGLGVDRSFANFLLVRFKDQSEAEQAWTFLSKHGYLVRKVGHYGLPEALRITIGTRDDVQAISRLLGEFCAQSEEIPS